MPDTPARSQVPPRVRSDPAAEQPDRGSSDALRPRHEGEQTLVPLQSTAATGDARGGAQHVLRVRESVRRRARGLTEPADRGRGGPRRTRHRRR